MSFQVPQVADSVATRLTGGMPSAAYLAGNGGPSPQTAGRRFRVLPPDELARVQIDIARLSRDIGRVQDKNWKMQLDLQRAQLQKKELRSFYQSLREEKRQFQVEREAAKAEADCLRALLEVEKGNVAEEKRKVVAMKMEVHEVLEDVHGGRRRDRGLQLQLASLREENERLEAENAALGTLIKNRDADWKARFEVLQRRAGVADGGVSLSGRGDASRESKRSSRKRARPPGDSVDEKDKSRRRRSASAERKPPRVRIRMKGSAPKPLASAGVARELQAASGRRMPWKKDILRDFASGESKL